MRTTLAIEGEYPLDWKQIARRVKDEAGWKCVRCGCDHHRVSSHTLTVHHFDGDKSNCAWWNLMALCQRCHLKIQARVNPHVAYFLEHSDWIKPYVAGFYAKKYEGLDLTREETLMRMDQLLGYEFKLAYREPERRPGNEWAAKFVTNLGAAIRFRERVSPRDQHTQLVLREVKECLCLALDGEELPPLPETQEKDTEEAPPPEPESASPEEPG